jgi:hypothetical protein
VLLLPPLPPAVPDEVVWTEVVWLETTDVVELETGAALEEADVDFAFTPTFPRAAWAS